MTTSPGTPSDDRPDHRLVGWKSIAAHIGVSVATARRWESDRGLPVHRVQGGTGASVLAQADEIDAWLASTPEDEGLAVPSGPDRKVGARWLAIAALLVSGALATFAIYGHDLYPAAARPATVRLVDGRHWVVEDVAGNELWRRSWADPLWHNLDPVGHVADLDGDGSLEVVVVAAHEEPPDQVLAYDGAGAEIWSYSPGERLTLDGETYDDLYRIEGVTLVSLADGTKMVAVNSHHRFYRPARLDLLDPAGELAGTYVHGGWITAVTPFQFDADASEELAFGAINNELGRPILGVLDVPFGRGFSPGIATASGSLEPGLELAYLALPRTRTSALLADHSWVEPITPDSRGAVSVQVKVGISTVGRGGVKVSGDSATGEYRYDFGPGLHFRRAHFTDIFRSLHRRLRAAGMVDFELEEEVVLGPPVWLVGTPFPRSSDRETR